MTLKLMMIAIRPYETKNGETRYKHMFVSAAGKYYSASSEVPKYEDRIVSDTDTYDDARAHAYEVQPNVWDGKLTYNVILS